MRERHTHPTNLSCSHECWQDPACAGGAVAAAGMPCCTARKQRQRFAAPPVGIILSAALLRKPSQQCLSHGTTHQQSGCGWLRWLAVAVDLFHNALQPPIPSVPRRMLHMPWGHPLAARDSHFHPCPACCSLHPRHKAATTTSAVPLPSLSTATLPPATLQCTAGAPRTRQLPAGSTVRGHRPTQQPNRPRGTRRSNRTVPQREVIHT